MTNVYVTSSSFLQGVYSFIFLAMSKALDQSKGIIIGFTSALCLWILLWSLYLYSSSRFSVHADLSAYLLYPEDNLSRNSNSSQNMYTLNTTSNINDTGVAKQCVCTRPDHDIKVINLGLMKAGSTTFHQTLHQFGCWSIHHGLHINRGQKQYINMTKWNTLSHSEQVWGRGNFSVKYTIGRVMKLAHSKGLPLLYFFNNSVNGFSQIDSNPYLPQVSHFDLLLEQYPSAKFVLMKRGIEGHIASIGRWGALREHLIERNIPYLPEGQGAEDMELANWISGHYERVRRHFTRFADPDQYLEIQLEDGNDFNTEKFKHLLHCERANVAMIQMNHHPIGEQKYKRKQSNKGTQRKVENRKQQILKQRRKWRAKKTENV